MSLSYRGPSGTIEYRWIAYALLRDNVLHYLAGDGAAFPHLHQIAEALGGDAVQIDALGLRREVEAAGAALLARPIADLAVSSRTRGALSYQAPPPIDQAATQLASACGFTTARAAPPAATLDDVFGFLVRGLIAITDGAQPGQVVDVVDL